LDDDEDGGEVERWKKNQIKIARRSQMGTFTHKPPTFLGGLSSQQSHSNPTQRGKEEEHGKARNGWEI